MPLSWYGHPSQNSDVYHGFQIPMNHPPTMGISSNCWPWHIWQGYIENCLPQPPFNQVTKRQRKSIISQLQKLHLAGFNIDIIIQYIKPTLSFQMGMNGTIGKGDIYIYEIYMTDRLQKLYEEGVINHYSQSLGFGPSQKKSR